MVQYTLAQSPEVILTVPGKDSSKAREKAMDKLMEMMDSGELPTELEDGFSAQQLIEVKEPPLDTTSKEDRITEAVQILSNLATLKLKVQESRSHLKEGFKVLKSFAQANMRYQQAKAKAQDARQILDQALKSSE